MKKGEVSPSPAVSIVMSVLNAEGTIAPAVQSILAQTFVDWELVIMDDGSVDGTRAALDRFASPNIRLVAHGERRGLAVRLNEGIALSRGAFIARMDADDIAYPERLERQLGFLQRHPQVDLVGSAAMAFRNRGEPIGVMEVAVDHAQICRAPTGGFNVPHPTWLGRRSFFQKFPYTETALRAQDQDLLLRAHRHAVFANLPEVLLGYRQESVSAGNIVRGRMHYCRAIAAYAWSQADYGLMARGLATQVTRAGVVPALVALGYSDYVLQRRYRAARADELSRWCDVAAAAHAWPGREPVSRPQVS